MSDFCELIFDSELGAWCTDTGKWPKERDWELFRQWFEWTAHDAVFDTFHAKLTLE